MAHGICMTRVPSAPVRITHPAGAWLQEETALLSAGCLARISACIEHFAWFLGRLLAVWVLHVRVSRRTEISLRSVHRSLLPARAR